MTRTRLLTPWRLFFQWTATLLLLLVPWIRISGDSLLRVDIPELSLFFFGEILRIEELYLFLFVCLGLVLLFLLVTLVFGRVWCGWSCPQTTLNDLAEWLARKLGLGVSGNRLSGPAWRKVLIQVVYIVLAFLVAANLLWYFIEPRQFFVQLAGWELHPAAGLTLAIVGGVVYIDLALIRRLMCSDFCPYGRIQTALVDAGTLTLHLPDAEKKRCLECGACVRSCPMEIDIRKGYQVECINCGRCLDACRRVMKPRGEEGLIRYSFGVHNGGIRALLNPRTIFIGLAFVVVSATLAIAIYNRPAASLKVSRSHLVAERKLANGELATFFNAWINNRGQQTQVFHITAVDPEDGSPLTVKGQTRRLEISGGDNRKIEFVLVTSLPDGKKKIVFLLRDKHGQTVARSDATISMTDNKP